MALSVNITINAQDDAFSPLEGQLLQILAGTPAAPAPAEEAPAEEAPAEEKPAPARKTARKAAPKEEPKTLQEELSEDAEEAEEAPAEEKPAPARKPARKAAPKKEEAPKEDEDDEEDLIGGEVTLKDAVQRASAAVAAGRSADVKKALAEAGAGRVSHLKGDAIATFIAALDG